MTLVVLGLVAFLVLAGAVLAYRRGRLHRWRRAQRFQRHLEAQAEWEQRLAGSGNGTAQAPGDEYRP